MISVDQALQQLLADAEPICETTTLPIDEAVSRVLATAAISGLDVPPADNSSMDGYAVLSNDIAADQHYQISQRIAAGTPPEPLVSGTVARIFTGAEMPAGADAIIIQENAQQHDDRVVFSQLPKPGDNIRPRGQDVTAGKEILAAGTRLRPQEIGLLASCGINEITVYKPLRLALVSTGDELVDLTSKPGPGQIYNSNKYLISAFCQQLGFEFIDMGACKDDLEQTKSLLAEAAEQADVVITTGGVSVGEEDHVKPAVEAIGQLQMWKLAIKPGKPLAFGKIKSADFIGLPGNPSSVFTTFLILALPRLKYRQGLSQQHAQKSFQLPAAFERGPVSRREYLRARTTAKGVEIFPNQSSGVLSSACWGDGFVIQYENSQISKNQLVEFLPYSNLFQ